MKLLVIVLVALVLAACDSNTKTICGVNVKNGAYDCIFVSEPE